MKRKIKTITAIIVTVSLIMSSLCISFAENEPVKVMLDGKLMTFDVDPVIKDGRTLIPFRAIFEALGCTVNYTMNPDGGGVETVEATKGTNTIKLAIGEYDMAVNGKTKGLDVCPIIKDGRTLIPLRAVSESLDCIVDWDGVTRTVSIMSGVQYRIEKMYLNKEVKDEAGNTLMKISIIYPEIDNPENNSFISEINAYYKKTAEDSAAVFEKENIESATEEVSGAYKPAELFEPYVLETDFTVSYDKNDIISISLHGYQNTGGAHPTNFMDSSTWDIGKGKKLTAAEALNITQENMDKIVQDSFVKWLLENTEVSEAEAAESVAQAVRNVEFYVTDNTVVLYYNEYVIAPHAAGIPMVEIPLVK